MKPYMALEAIGKRVVLLMMRTKAAATCSLQDSFWVFPCLLALFLFHVLLELFLVADASPLLRVHTPVELVGIKVGEVVQVIDLLILQRQPQVLADQAGHITVLNRLLWCGLWGLRKDLIVDLGDLLVYSVLIVLHQVEEEGYLHGQLRKVALFGVAQIILPLLQLEVGQKRLPLRHKEGLFKRYLNHLDQLPSLESSQQMPLSTFHQHQGLPCLPKLSHHLNIAVQLLKGEFATIQYFIRSLNHLLEGWDFLIEDIDQERYILL